VQVDQNVSSPSFLQKDKRQSKGGNDAILPQIAADDMGRCAAAAKVLVKFWTVAPWKS